MTADKGERAPKRILVVVRAIAPVAGMPPKKGQTILATPKAMSSALGLCLVLAMPSATTAESRDSMAPSMAMAKADGKSARIFRQFKAKPGALASAKFQGSRKCGAA